jgi:hypothetical protein
MNDDKKLLLLAAKAAGATPFDWDTSRDGLFIRDGKPIILANGDHDGDWNPLADDGDALRLAAKLNLSIITSWGFDGEPSGSVGTMLGSSEDLRLTSTPHGDDPCAAWRRAIVLAAAEIGKTMP